MTIGKDIYELATALFPICRSITGDGVRESLAILKKVCSKLEFFEVPSGTAVFDWVVPKEWNIKEAYIKNSSDERIIDFKRNNLHVVGYSAPVNRTVTLKELLKYIYTQPEQPDVIPYVTSYYKECFGFCMSENQKKALKEDSYQMVIESTLEKGHLTYGEIIIPGSSEEEVFLSTYICHPSMANDNISGPVVAIYLAKWLKEIRKLRYTYRIIFVPETIGAITYLKYNLDAMKKKMVAGFNLSCIGDEGNFSYIESRYANTLADKVIKNILSSYDPDYKQYSFLTRGSDERQYCFPGIDLPLCSVSKSKVGEYPEYHTSADNLSFISPKGLENSYEVLQECIMALENNYKYKMSCLCEPQLGRRGLYPTISHKGSAKLVKSMMDFLVYADGTNDLIDISNIIGVPVKELLPIIIQLEDNKLVSK